MKRYLFLRFSRITIFIFGVVLIGGAALIAMLFRDLPSVNDISSAQSIESTRITDRTGTIILYELYKDQRRISIPLEEIPDYVRHATIAIEDKDFYSHEAISYRGILRSLIANVLERSIVQGGSTITQQLARTMFLTTERTTFQKIIRKLKEIIVAYRIEHQYSKDKILELYLNQIPYGGELYGIESASQAIFKKPAKDLTLAESALLASLPKGPSYYSPWGSHVPELLKRKDVVLAKMAEQGFITEEEMTRAQNVPLRFAPRSKNMLAPHFVLAVTKYLNATYGEQFVRTAGLTVRTTLDANLQTIAERAVLGGATRNSLLYDGENAALVAQDARTGEIIALVGSRNYFDETIDGQFDIATQGLRQPGSAIKPFAYYAAFVKGYTPSTILFDVPTDFNATTNPNATYMPSNFDGAFRGPVTMRQGLGQSLNIPAVKTLYLAGLPETVRIAQTFGITTLSDPWHYGLSLALGGGEVKLIDLIGAYSVFARDGIKQTQTIILEVRDKNNTILESFTPRGVRVGDAQATRLVNDILSDIETRSGLFHGSLPLTIFPGYDIALKTGTTNDYRDAWAFGYTPSLVVGVWAGNNNNRPMQAQGGSILAAIPIWNQFMRDALPFFPQESFIKPEPITTNKPILNGEYITTLVWNNQTYPHIHDILYYVEKNNPRGPLPLNPNADPQFIHWEEAALEWARANVPQFEQYNHPLPSGATLQNTTSYTQKTSITIHAPRSGDFIRVTSPLTISGTINPVHRIEKIELLINNVVVASDTMPFETSREFRFDIIPVNLAPQNSIRVRTTSSQNDTTENAIIIYRAD